MNKSDLKSHNKRKCFRPISGTASDKKLKNPSLQIAIRFNDEMFGEIKRLAIENDRPFAHIVRRLCGIALESRKKDGAIEAAADERAGR